MPERPYGLKPGVMADFPQRRIDDFEDWAHELFSAKIGDEFKGSLTGILYQSGELCGPHAALLC